MNLDLDALAAAANTIASSAVGWEMAVRLGQSLEITDGLWELVPVVVAAGERVDERPAAQAADLSPAARDLGSGDRARLQALGDQFLATLDAAVAGQRIDEDALGSLTPAELASPALVRDLLLLTRLEPCGVRSPTVVGRARRWKDTARWPQRACGH